MQHWVMLLYCTALEQQHLSSLPLLLPQPQKLSLLRVREREREEAESNQVLKEKKDERRKIDPARQKERITLACKCKNPKKYDPFAKYLLNDSVPTFKFQFLKHQ